MPTDTKLNQLIINQLTQEQYDEAKAAGTLSDTELYITDSDDDPQVKSNLSQTIDDSTTKYPSNKAVKDESSRITTLMNTKVSNCITEIPQDIKLELNNNNTIVLKKGSIVYIPNGTGNFDKVTITQDVSDLFSLENGTYGRSILNNSSIKNFFSLEEENLNILQQYENISDREKIEIKSLKRGESLMIVGDDHIVTRIESADFEDEIITGG